MYKLFLYLIILGALIIFPANAELLSGNVGGPSVSSVLLNNSGGGATSTPPAFIQFPTVETTEGLSAVIRFVLVKPDTFAAGSLIGNSVPVTATLSGHTYGNGTIGYQRVLNGASPPVDIAGGYIWMTFPSWNITGQTGSKNIVLTYNSTALGITAANEWNAPAGGVGANKTGSFYSATGGWLSGNYVFNYNTDESATYNFTKPSGLGISGTVDNRIGNSRVFIIDGLTNSIITSDVTYNTNIVNLNTNANSIYFCLLGSSGIWYNTSRLFTPGGPTITPTPAPTIPSGYVRTTFHAWDSMANAIHGANINLYDVEAGTWTNSTNDADGVSYIDTLPYHTLNAYGTFTVFPGEFSDATLTGVETGTGGEHYYLTMYPGALNPGLGNTNLFITAYDADDNGIIRNVAIQARLPSGATYGENTGTGGTATIVVPNNTTVSVSASKSGYLGATVTVNSGTGLSYAANLVMHKATATPTVTRTVVPGEVTVRPTLDMRSSGQKDQAMMDLVRDNGEGLIGLAILVTFLSLFGLMRKGM